MGVPYIAVELRAMVTGEQLIDATQVFDPTTNEPAVSIRFDGAGGRRFARVTQDNVGKPFAIILDDVVISAPNINEPILGGQAQITGSFTVETANDLAIRSEEHTSELQSLMRISYAVFCLKKKN